MRQSGNKNGFTAIGHFTYDVILPQLSPAQQSVLLRIYRQTIGWKKQFDRISLSQFRKKTGIKTDVTVRNTLDALDVKILSVQESGEKEADSSLIIIPTELEYEYLNNRQLIVMIGEATEVADFGLPYMMLDPESAIATQREKREQERILWKKRHGET